MTVISANPNASLVPKFAKSNAPAEREVSETPTAAIPSAMIELANAEGLKQLERIQTIMELMQEASKKMTAEVSIKASKGLLKMAEKTLSIPFEEPQIISGEEAKKIIADGEKLMKKRFGYVPSDYSFIYEGTDISYRVKSDGSVTKKFSWAADTKDAYDETEKERSRLSMTLSSGVYEAQISAAEKRMDNLKEKLGPLSEQEQEFLSGFKPLFSYWA